MKQIRIDLQDRRFRLHREYYAAPITDLLCCLATGHDRQGVPCRLYWPWHHGERRKRREWVSVVERIGLRPYFKWLYELQKRYDILMCKPEQLRDLADILTTGPRPAIRRQTKALLDRFIMKLFSYNHLVNGEQLVVEGKGIGCGYAVYRAYWRGTKSGIKAEWNAWALYDAIVNNPDAPVRYCPYCNADTLYAFKFIRRSGDGTVRLDFARSAFDHFFSCKDYPVLAMTISNLVPSCTRCNTRFKVDENAGCRDTSLILPYAEDMDTHLKFTWGEQIKKALLCSLTPDELVVDYNVDSAKSGALAEGTMELFHIKEVYESIYADDICSIPLVLNDVYSLVETDTERILRKKDITGQIRFPETIPDWTDDRKRLLLGCPRSREGINAHRLSKIKMDLVDELEKDRLPA